MKKLLFFIFILVSSLKSHSQTVGINPNPNPPPKDGLCGIYCFENTTDCYVYVCLSSQDVYDPCVEGGISGVSIFKCIILEAHQKGCIDVGYSDKGNCRLCPNSFFVNICGNNQAPCYSFQSGTLGGQGFINCGGPSILTTCFFDQSSWTYLIKKP